MPVTAHRAPLQPPAEPAPAARRWALLQPRNLLRAAMLVAVLLVYATLLGEHPEPIVMAVGLAPILWLLVEAAWRLMDALGGEG